jgi:hypothetical protein
MSLLTFLTYAIALAFVPMGQADSDRIFQVFAQPLRQLPEQCAEYLACFFGPVKFTKEVPQGRPLNEY